MANNEIDKHTEYGLYKDMIANHCLLHGLNTNKCYKEKILSPNLGHKMTLDNMSMHAHKALPKIPGSM